MEEYDSNDLEDLQECLTQKEKNRIDGKGFFWKFIKRIRDKRQAKNIEIYDTMIKNIEKDNVSNLIPEEYRKYNEK